MKGKEQLSRGKTTVHYVIKIYPTYEQISSSHRLIYQTLNNETTKNKNYFSHQIVCSNLSFFFFFFFLLLLSLQLEQSASEIEQFYLASKKKQPNGSKGSSMVKDKDKERHVPSIKKQQQDAARREAVAAKRMQELMRQFGTILRQVTNSLVFSSILLLIFRVLSYLHAISSSGAFLYISALTFRYHSISGPGRL